MGRFAAWRKRQPSRVLYVAVPSHGSTIVAAGLRKSRDFRGVRMVEVIRP